jgi:hypothetical protein
MQQEDTMRRNIDIPFAAAWIGVLALVILAEGAATVRAQATTIHSNLRVDVVDVAFSPCTQENIILSGQQHIVTKTTFDAGGGAHTVLHLNELTMGTGEISGAQYQHTAAINDVSNARGPGPVEITIQLHNHLISQGDFPNHLIHSISHFTINANGEITGMTNRLRIECSPG